MSIYFTIFEILLFSLFILCLRHAIKEGLQAVLRLLAGVAFGVLLEWATIVQLDAYSYGRFIVMVDTVPVVIGVGWGIILYSAMLFSNSTKLPWYLRPFLDGLLALNIDLAMDALAIRLGMWDWGSSLANEYYGVPFENFWAWFWVIFSFSLFFRVFDQLKSPIKVWLAPLMAMGLGVFGVLGTNLFITRIVPEEFDWLATITVVLISLGILIARRDAIRQRDEHSSLAFWVPFGVHGYFVIIGLVSGYIFQPIILLFVSILMLLVSFGIHWDPIQKYLSKG